MDWVQDLEQLKKDHHKHVLSFSEYMKIVKEHPRSNIRTAAIYLKDMFDHYGHYLLPKTSQKRFKIFDIEHHNSPPVYGQEQAQKQIYQYLSNFIDEGFINRFILMVGPNGSSKSSIIKKIMHCCEDYSETEQGALYTFSWIFPVDQYVKGSLGLGSTTRSSSQSFESYAHLDDHEITTILPSDFKDHPLLLIPKQARRKLIDSYLSEQTEIYHSIKKSYLYNGDLSHRNKHILDALLKNYKGDHTEVYKHIRIERFQMSKRYASAAVTIEPQMHVDAAAQQITMDRRLSSLPPSLQSLNLFTWHGEIVLANRGVLEFSDLLKRPLDTYKYLLTTMETKTINVKGMITELDILFIGTSNEVHFQAFKQHPDFNSFRGRFNFLKVPYLLNFRDEIKIYQEQVENLEKKSFFEPHAIESLAMWATMTRLRRPKKENYRDKKVGELIEKFNPLEKILFISETEVPHDFESKEIQVLKNSHKAILKEYRNDLDYEGKFGVSPREIKEIIYNVSLENKCITFSDILEYLKDFTQKKEEYDFLNISEDGDYHNSESFIQLLNNYFQKKIDQEIRDCLGLIDDRSYEDYIEKYILNINALIKKEKIKNQVTGKFEEPDQYFIKEFESNIMVKENVTDYRSHLISKLGAYFLDNPGKKIIYTEVFRELSTSLKESFRDEQKKILKNLSDQFYLYWEKNTSSDNNKKIIDQIDSIKANLCKNYHYSEEGALKSLKFILDKLY